MCEILFVAVLYKTRVLNRCTVSYVLGIMAYFSEYTTNLSTDDNFVLFSHRYSVHKSTQKRPSAMAIVHIHITFFVLIVIHCRVPQETHSIMQSVNEKFIEPDIGETIENIGAINALEHKQLKISFVEVECAIMDELYLNPNFEKYVDSIVSVSDSSMGAFELSTKFPAAIIATANHFIKFAGAAYSVLFDTFKSNNENKGLFGRAFVNQQTIREVQLGLIEKTITTTNIYKKLHKMEKYPGRICETFTHS